MVGQQLSIFESFLQRCNLVHHEGLVRAMHFKITALLLVLCCLLVTVKEHFSATSSVIDCDASSKINTHCLAEGIFVLDDGHKEFLTYYQWVLFFLAFQAVCFIAPHKIHNYVEDGKIAFIVSGLKGWILDTKRATSVEQDMANYIVETKGRHRNRTLKLLLVYSIYLLNVVLQIVFTDLFLGHAFYTFGFKTISFLFSKVIVNSGTHCGKTQFLVQ